MKILFALLLVLQAAQAARLKQIVCSDEDYLEQIVTFWDTDENPYAPYETFINGQHVEPKMSMNGHNDIFFKVEDPGRRHFDFNLNTRKGNVFNTLVMINGENFVFECLVTNKFRIFGFEIPTSAGETRRSTITPSGMNYYPLIF